MKKSDNPTGILEGSTPAERYNPNQEEREILTNFASKLEECQTSRSGLELQWALNKEYMEGHHILVYDVFTRDVFRFENSDIGNLLAIDNILPVAARALLGKLTRVIPTIRAIPATADLSDLKASMAVDALLEYYNRTQKLDVKYVDLTERYINDGTVVAKVYWDQSAGAKVGKCKKYGYITYDIEEVGNPCPDALVRVEDLADLRKDDFVVEGREGDVAVDVLDIDDIFFDPAATSLETANYVIHRAALPINQIREDFPEKGKYVAPENGLYRDAFASLGHTAVSNFSLNNHPTYTEYYARLYEYQERPSEKYPRGRVLYIANGVLLEERDNPIYKILGRFNMYPMRFGFRQKDIYGESPIVAAWPLQREYNILLTQMREHREYTLRPKLLAGVKSRINQDELEHPRTRIISWNDVTAKEPHYLQIPQFPQYVYQETHRLKSSILEKFAVTEQELGMDTDASGRKALIIETESSQQVGPVLRRNNNEWLNLHWAMVLLNKYLAPSRKRWATIGEDRPHTFYIEDMSDIEGMDLQLVEEDSMSRNPSLRLRQAIELAQVQVFTGPDGKFNHKAFAEKAKLKLPYLTPDYAGSEIAFAASIPNMLEHGETYEPQPWDDATVFEKEFRGWLGGPGRVKDAFLVKQVRALWEHYAKMLAGGQQGGQAAQQQRQSAQRGAMPSSAMTAPPGEQEAQANMQQAEQAKQMVDRQAQAIAAQQQGQENQ